jgi:hypothetical protein
VRLALVLLVSCRGYVSEPNEANWMVGSIESGAQLSFQLETMDGDKFVHRFCPSAKGPHLPNTPWNDPAWACLKVENSTAQKYTYEYRSNGRDGADAECTIVATRPVGGGKVHELTAVLHGTAEGVAKRVFRRNVER